LEKFADVLAQDVITLKNGCESDLGRRTLHTIISGKFQSAYYSTVLPLDKSKTTTNIPWKN
jgi:hypothetical protein